MKYLTLSLFLWWMFPALVFSQGQGGGVYIDDNGSCVGSVIHGNQAQDGFGVAGGEGVLLNTTVIGNEELKQNVKAVVPGDIYCANGDIVDTVAYKKRANKDAIGIVFWVSGDPKAIYPKGAVIALKETQGSWGIAGGFSIAAGWPESEVQSYFYLKDTACYGNTRKLYEEAIKSSNNQTIYRAGFYSYTYQATGQIAEHPVKWCLPVYMYLRRLFGVLPGVESSLRCLLKQHQGESDFNIDLFSDKEEAKCWYWSCDDGGPRNYNVWMVNFKTGLNGQMGTVGVSLKNMSHNVRPMFLY